MRRKSLKSSHYRVGPDELGCCNSGIAPTIFRAGGLRGADTDRYYVGAQRLLWHWDDAGRAIQANRIEDTSQTRRALRKHSVRVYKTSGAAHKDWENRCRNRIEDNRSLRIEEARERAEFVAGLTR